MGYGDEIMATAQARRLKEDNPNKRVLIGDGHRVYVSALHEGNGNLTFPPGVQWTRLAAKKRGIWYPANSIFKPGSEGDRYLWLKNYPGSRPYMNYRKTTAERCSFYRNLNLQPGDIFLSTRERNEADLLTKRRHVKKYLLIAPYAKKTHSASNKDWGLENWNKVVRHFQSMRVHTVCLTPPNERPLPGASLAVRPRNFRTACAVVSNCRAFATIEGGIHHAAAAFNKPGVVIFGGYISPDITGYEIHDNICPENGETPCGSRFDCPHCKSVMRSISVEEVVHKIEEVWSRG
jgi:ADP-heptose:LPS heptosyltransferase